MQTANIDNCFRLYLSKRLCLSMCKRVLSFAAPSNAAAVMCWMIFQCMVCEYLLIELKTDQHKTITTTPCPYAARSGFLVVRKFCSIFAFYSGIYRRFYSAYQHTSYSDTTFCAVILINASPTVWNANNTLFGLGWSSEICIHPDYCPLNSEVLHTSGDHI